MRRVVIDGGTNTMCPACLTSMAITVAATTNAGIAVTALVARARRAILDRRATAEREPTPTPHVCDRAERLATSTQGETL